VVTSRRFLDRAGIELPEGVEPTYVEDVLRSVGRAERWLAAVLALLGPARLIERACGGRGPPAPDDELTVIFSSGSTGEPKGIALSHRNLDANVEAVAGIFHPEPDEGIVGILPLFHSLGYLALWYSAIHGVRLAFSPNPLDSRAVARLIARYRLTILIATPTFLRLYARRCDPSMLKSLRIVLSGAEKLTPEVAAAIERRLGIRPIEGYGATECGPVVAAEEPDFLGRGSYPPATGRRGTVGRPVPGVVVRAVSPETLEPMGDRAAGLLLVRGPNVMSGYIGREDRTAEAMHGGWYVTGDVGAIDGDGLLRILDRLSRFSKIGGEMVPHGRIERALHEAAGASDEEPSFAVTGVPDERKGERLAVLHTEDPGRVPDLVERLSGMGLPPLYIPRPEQFVRVEEIPTLATGKLDLKRVKRMARESTEGERR